MNKNILSFCFISEIFFGLKKGTSAPYFSDIFLIFLSSVDTIILFKSFDFFAAKIEYEIKGFPKKFLKFYFNSLTATSSWNDCYRHQFQRLRKPFLIFF